MRWGSWYRDGDGVVHLDTKLRATSFDLQNPATLAAFVDGHHEQLSTLDVVHLLIAANTIEWRAFDFEGVGDWLDARGEQRGRAARPTRARTCSATVHVKLHPADRDCECGRYADVEAAWRTQLALAEMA